MSAPAGFKTIEEIAVEMKVPMSRVQAAINALNIPQQSFPPDRRRRYYAPQDVVKIKEWLENR
jgi:DNA-binding transcriptional regulator GbsR (MarR family)